MIGIKNPIEIRGVGGNPNTLVDNPENRQTSLAHSEIIAGHRFAISATPNLPTLIAERGANK